MKSTEIPDFVREFIGEVMDYNKANPDEPIYGVKVLCKDLKYIWWDTEDNKMPSFS